MVGGYIYQKFGQAGLLVAMQNYEHELPITEFAKEFSGEDIVSILNI